MISSKSYGLQNETRQYLRRLYAYGKELAGTDVNDVDNFVKGLKQLNLWQNIICWPLRSIHNIGTGSRVLSMGGYGPFDATLLNSATWSNDGVNRVTAGGDLFSTPIRELGVAPISHGAVVKNATDLGDNVLYWITAGVNVNGRQFSILTSAAPSAPNIFTWISLWPPSVNGPGIIPISGGDSFTRTTRHYFSMRLTSSITSRFTVNSNQVSQGFGGAGWNESNPQFVRFGAHYAALNLTASFVFLSNSLVTDAQDSAMYLLLKQTIGKGLGLP